MLSITTDYVQDIGNPEPHLRRIAEEGVLLAKAFQTGEVFSKMIGEKRKDTSHGHKN